MVSGPLSASRVLVAVAAVALVPLMLLALVIVSVTSGSSSVGSAGRVCSPGPTPQGTVAGYGGEQLANAGAIVAAGQQMRLPQQAWVIAVATAMQESTLLNVSHGDADSLGLFQQRTSWGPVRVRMDPTGSARLFYERLMRIPDWRSLPLTVAAQSVQVSAFPDAYADHEQAAREVVGAVLGIGCQQMPAGAQPVLDRALSVADRPGQPGVPYSWGGGNADGPSPGIPPDTDIVGFDCSGLAVFAYAAVGIAVPHQTQAIWDRFQPAITDPAQVAPGDLILLSDDGTPNGIHHVGIYLGDGRVIDAPQPGGTVGVRDHIWEAGAYYATEFIGAVRPTVGSHV